VNPRQFTREWWQADANVLLSDIYDEEQRGRFLSYLEANLPKHLGQEAAKEVIAQAKWENGYRWQTVQDARINPRRE